MRHATAVVLTLSLGIRPVLQAQLPLAAGEQVRITSIRNDVHAQVGSVLSTTGDSVVVLAKGMRTIALPVTAIDRLEVLQASRATARGVQIGATLGAFAGFIYGIASYQQCPPQSDAANCLVTSMDGGPVAFGIIFAAGGGAIGAGIGAIIGTAVHEHRWVTVPTYRASVVTRALPAGGLGVGLTLSL